jgi:hypothetical protein
VAVHSLQVTLQKTRLEDPAAVLSDFHRMKAIRNPAMCAWSGLRAFGVTAGIRVEAPVFENP